MRPSLPPYHNYSLSLSLPPGSTSVSPHCLAYITGEVHVITTLPLVQGVYIVNPLTGFLSPPSILMSFASSFPASPSSSS
ncbi:hypothetical protein SESBI_24987, partial [Sesbania bispinosa]